MRRLSRKHSSIKHGTIELVLLALLQNEEKYGYQLAIELEEFSDGRYELKEATMYPTLYRMLQNEYVTSEQRLVGERRQRVYYQITEKGREHLEKLILDYHKVIKGIDMILEAAEENRQIF